MAVSLAHPEVLAPDWVPPTPLRHRVDLERAVAWLGEPFPPTPPPYAACITGPRGAGTSTLARLAARRVLEALRREHVGDHPRLIAVRAREHRGTHGVATALLRELDPSFVGRGFPVAQVLAGLIRRLCRENSPVVVVLDDCGRAMPMLAPVLRAFLFPARFLPEGIDRGPPAWVILAGSPELRDYCTRSGGCPALETHHLQIGAPTVGDLEALVVDRFQRARGVPPPEGLAPRLAKRAAAGSFGFVRAVELLRRELLGSEVPGPSYRAQVSVEVLSVEPHVLRALRAATREHPAAVGEVRVWEHHYARLGGERVLPATTLWRRLVQLEAAGYVRRAVRIGGSGGTRSEISLLRPLDGLVRSLVSNPRVDVELSSPAPPAPSSQEREAPLVDLPPPRE